MNEIFCSPEIEHQEIPVLQDKNVLVVGGTHGIGEAVARKCMLAGADVTVIGRTPNEDLMCHQVMLDVVDNPTVVEKYYKGKNYVFNNIGIYEKNTLSDTSEERLHQVLNTNIATMFLLSQYSVRHALDAVVNMASRPTLEKYHSWGLYTLSKQAVITMTQAAAEEAQAKFYAICPSRVDTKFREEVFPGEDKKTRLTPEETADVILKLFNGKNPSGQYYWIKKLYA